MTQATEPHPALAHRCPFCHAEPGQPCRKHRGAGAEADRPHSRRVRLSRPLPQTPPVQALCCECGNLRTCKEPRNTRGYWGHADWHRELGDLKCSACGHVTTHALLGQDYGHRDYEEDMQRVALGGELPKGWHWDVDRLRRTYRQGNLPRNPNLNHWYVVDDAQAAWDAGERTVAALCGEQMTLHRRPGTSSARVPMTELVEPDEMRDMDYEDAETGQWWVDMDCVNCLRVTNTKRLARKRRALLTQLLELTAAVDKLGAADLIELQEHVERIMAND